MARLVEWSEAAAQDLAETAEYIARDSPRYASALVSELMRAARSLSEMAERGRMVPELEQANLQELIIRSYRRIYHLTTDRVQILGFTHGARDLPTLWVRESRTPDPPNGA